MRSFILKFLKSQFDFLMFSFGTFRVKRSEESIDPCSSSDRIHHVFSF